MNLVGTIKELQIKKVGKVSLNALEKEVGFGKSTISSWEKKQPSVDKICVLADYFGVTTDYLLGREQKGAHAAPLSSDEAELLEKFNAFPASLKSHTLKYLALLESERSSFAASLLTEEQAEELLALTAETYPDHSANSRKAAR